ncbi:MAG: hypothetical protein QF745_01845, partial [Planctomycetota bacterium]|nr:hypothetical protein [Planctomycetota bacterium]
MPEAQKYSQTELIEQRKAQFEADSNKTRDQIIEDAQNEPKLTPVPTSLPIPEWIDKMVEGVSTEASSARDHRGAFPAERATVLEPIPITNLPALFQDENDSRIWTAQRVAVDYKRLRYESQFWPKWFRDEPKFLASCYPDAKYFDTKKWKWHGPSTPSPRDGHMRCNVPYLLNAGGGMYRNGCHRGKWFQAPAYHEDAGCPRHLTPKEYSDTQRFGQKITMKLRHRYAKEKCPDGATFEAEKLAWICSKAFGWRVTVKTLWQLVQEGQGNTKARVMILLACDEAGSVVGWDENVFGKQPKDTECAEFCYRNFYYLPDRESPMRVLG